jgi:hypothetical protein
MGVKCSCNADSQSRICLASLPEGEIIGEFKTNSEAQIITISKEGEINGIDAEFGFDKVFKDSFNTNGYFVLSTNRENSPLHTFDKVFLVLFGPNKPPSITKVIDEPGFGDYRINEWFYIPISKKGQLSKNDDKDLTLKTVSALGEYIDEYKFGPTLVSLPGYDKQMFLYNFEILSDGKILITFGKDLLGDPYSQYIIDPKEKSLKKI